MITASFAGDQGKDVFAVPGSILSPYSSGCNQLLREGAEVLTEATDILWRLPIGHFLAGLDEAVRQVTDTNPQGREDGQNTSSGLILHALSGCALTMDELASKVDLLLPEAAAAPDQTGNMWSDSVRARQILFDTDRSLQYIMFRQHVL